ncbi:5242_t:CDS:2 [Funneliformis geosporum]|uniref:5242_t:CDS:1 n=1 Tax=Funneliformis geosporum TaxID=1117311 RepID=A0A9W4SMG8_9GLOM|nr:5242_t:CDS:2 [Funneliformis geosporum]
MVAWLHEYEKNSKYKKLEQQFDQNKKYFESRCNELEQKLKDERSQIRSLEKRNGELEKEASNYQSALGVATSFNLSDDDQNHSVRLNQDILSLHDTLENYVTNLKPNIDVNIKEAKKILHKYKCQTEISEKKPNKPVIKAALQRHVLEVIFEQADFYFTRSNKEHYLESEIVSKTVELTDLMENFYNNRLGDDRVTRHTPIKLRQQVYSALGTRGFNDIVYSNGISKNSKHNFIHIISKKINKMMNKFRVIKDVEKRRYVNSLAEDLIRDVVRIFYFRLKIQEPMAQYRWYENNEKINKSTMKSVSEKIFNATKSLGNKVKRFYSGGENSNLSIDSVNTYEYVDSDAEMTNNEDNYEDLDMTDQE